VEAGDERATLVMTEIRDADGLMRRSVHITADGRLQIEGHDLGAAVERTFGSREYEFERSLSAAETTRLAELLAVPVDELLPAIESAFDTTHVLEKYLEEHGIAGKFWSRVGD
jgi:hypothetical protein